MNEVAKRRSTWADPLVPENPPAEPWMKLATGVLIAFAIGLLAFTAVAISQAPDEVPVHFDLLGRANRYGPPEEMRIVSLLCAATTGLLFLAWRPANSLNVGTKAPASEAGWRAMFHSVRVVIFALVGLTLVLGYLLSDTHGVSRWQQLGNVSCSRCGYGPHAGGFNLSVHCASKSTEG